MSERPPQFGRVPTAIVTSGILTQVKPAACKVYLCLCARASLQWQARVGVRRLAADAGYLIGTISAAIGQLRELGLITTNQPKQGQAYTYTLTLKCSAPAEQSTVQRPPNTSGINRSAPAEHFGRKSVQRPLKKCSAPAEHNRQENRQEKRVERKPDDQLTLPDMPNPEACGPDPDKAPAFTFQTTTGPWIINAGQLDKLRDEYTYVHVDTELAGLAAWTEANPDRRKPPGAMHGWLRVCLTRKQAERPRATPAFYAGGFFHTSLPTDPTHEEAMRILGYA